MNILRIRILLDDAQIEAYRDIEICESDHFESLHLKIVESFGLRGDQMASFYRSDDNWEKGSEIPLMNMEDGEESMRDVLLSSDRCRKGSRYFYIYNFLTLWIFYVEVMEVKKKEKAINYPIITERYGSDINEDQRDEDSEMPEMESVVTKNKGDDPFDVDEYDIDGLDPLDGEFEDIDDFDF